MNRIKMNNKGFTLVELIVVIAILAIITVVVAPQYLQYVEKSRIGTDENTIGEIAHVAEITWVERKANNDALGEVQVTVATNPYGITATGDTGFAAEVLKVIPKGQYAFKSEKYTVTTKSVVITISDKGIASWTKADGTVMGAAQ